MTGLPANVLAAKARLAEAHAQFRQRHQAGCPALELCAAMTGLRDAVVRDLFTAAVEDLGGPDSQGSLSDIALVAHAGYGRRDVAPGSDVDLMVLHEPSVASQVAPLADRLLRDVFDAGLILGHSVRTPGEACRLALADPQICSSLVESRLLAGDERLFRRFARRFKARVRRRAGTLMAAMEQSRREEQIRYGETVFLLEPNVKRSRGTLRDIQLIRWIGFARHGTNSPERLRRLGELSGEDWEAICRAGEFLLGLRNELHFQAGKASDVLTRAEQLRIAELRGYQRAGGLLPVEQFMRDYFRHTSAVSDVATRFVARARSSDRRARLGAAVFGRRIEPGLRVGPAGILASRKALERLEGDLAAVVRLADLAGSYDKPIAPHTWEAVRRQAARLPDDLPPAACRHFLSLLSHPQRLAPLLRDLHEAAVLQRFVPEFERARGLLQFNQYHKYTVDEHCLRAVECATEMLADAGPVGRAYRRITRKHVLHLALLIHDLGKGSLEDHREVGLQIAQSTARRLGLDQHESAMLEFLVHKHLRMNHLAFRRDTGDEDLVVRFAMQVGSPEMLQMLYVLTAADLAAVGPDVWDGWKSEILTDLYHRTMQHLAGESPATTIDELMAARRQAVGAALGPLQGDPWFDRQISCLPDAYLNVTSAQQVAEDLRGLRQLQPGDVRAAAQYIPETNTVQFTVSTSERVAAGIFHRLTGALTSHGLEIRSAQIHTLAGDMVLDRFWVCDPDYAGPPPADRLDEINRSLEQSLRGSHRPPSFRRLWRASGSTTPSAATRTQVRADNTTSERYTILDIFTLDRTGLLYAITRSLFELGLPVARAKIGTYLDQVVDVFYVTNLGGKKIEDPGRLDEICARLLEVIDAGAGLDEQRSRGAGAEEERKTQLFGGI